MGLGLNGPGPTGLGPHDPPGPHCGLMGLGQAPLGPHGPGPNALGLHGWALMGQALMGRALMGRALMGTHGPRWALIDKAQDSKRKRRPGTLFLLSALTNTK